MIQTVDVCIEKYMELSKAVFRLDNVKMGVPVGDNRCRFDEIPLEKALKDLIREITHHEDSPMADPHDQNPEKSCPVFVVATEGQDASSREKLFRSYGFDKDRCPIWQAARATSAAPSYFPPAWVEFPAPGGWYIDGGLKRNNPSEVALAEAKRYWKTAKRVMIVSIGTGVQKTADFIENPEPPEKRSDEQTDTETEKQPDDSMQPKTGSFGGVKQRFKRVASSFAGKVKAATSNLPSTSSVAQYSRIPGGLMTLKRFAAELVKLSTESEDTHRNLWECAHSHDESQQFPYYRFNVPAGMDEIGLEEWKNMIKMGALTRGYLRTPLVEKEMERCAESVANPWSFEST
jgi:predicted acylesterase/phospholipase RssA